MKKTLFFLTALLATVAGCVKYEYNTEFKMPSELVSPAPVTLDVTSSATVVLSWKGGGAVDGGVVLYNVLFDREGGDFSNPIVTMQSDLGANPCLTLSHATLNTIARKAGIAPNESGKIIWTVTGAKGGETRKYDGFAELKVTRGEGIDNIPEHLYINGSAALESGQEFRVAEEGLYIIYTEAGAGDLFMSSERGGGFRFYADDTGKLNEGEGSFNLTEAPETGLVRITVNFNTLAFTIEEVEKTVRAIWGATYADIAVLEYTGNGEFTGDGDVVFYGPGRDGTPDWCSWVEERYYFIATVNGVEVCWGSTFGAGSWTPDGTEEYYDVVENPWTQWDNLWKMDHAFDLCHVTFTIYTNKNNRMTHAYAGGAIVYDQPTETPLSLVLGGSASETDGQTLRKEGDKFVIYNKFKDGEFSLADGDGRKYFADADGKLFIGNRKTAISASEGVTRIIVDFESNTVKYDAVGANVWVENAWDHIVMATLEYQGLGKWAGEGQIKFAANGDERYSMRTTINGNNMRWGSNRGNDGKLPETEEDWWLYESEWDGHQWDNLYKFDKNDQDKNATFIVDGNNPVHMTHSVIVASTDPVHPSVAPAELALYGTGAEMEGQPFRKISEGVFQIVTKLESGNIFFKSGNKTYFTDGDLSLWEGEGEYDCAATEGLATRITVDFVGTTVKFENISYLKCIFGANYYEIMNFSYSGNGVFSGEGRVNFLQPGDVDWLTWVEERYYYIATIDEADVCWGRVDGASAERPDNPSTYDETIWYVEEFVWSQWDHLWKFASNIDQSVASIVINTNDNGHMTQTVTKK